MSYLRDCPEQLNVANINFESLIGKYLKALSDICLWADCTRRRSNRAICRQGSRHIRCPEALEYGLQGRVCVPDCHSYLCARFIR